MRRGTLSTFSPSSLHARLRPPCLPSGSSSTAAQITTVGSSSFSSSFCASLFAGVVSSNSLAQQRRWQGQATATTPSSSSSSTSTDPPGGEAASASPSAGSEGGGGGSGGGGQEDLPPVIVEPEVPPAVKNAIDDVYALTKKSGGAMPLGRALKAQKPTVTHIAGTNLGVRQWIEQYPTKFELYEASNGGLYIIAVDPDAAAKRQSMVESYYQKGVARDEAKMAAAAHKQFEEAEVVRKAKRAEWEEAQRTVELRKEFVPKFAQVIEPQYATHGQPGFQNRHGTNNRHHGGGGGGGGGVRHQSYVRLRNGKLVPRGDVRDPASLPTLMVVEKKAIENGTQADDLFEADQPLVPLDGLNEDEVAFHECFRRHMKDKRWEQIGYLHDTMFRSEEAKLTCNMRQFNAYVRAHEDYFWCAMGLVCLRREGQTKSPILTKDDYDIANGPKKKMSKTQKEAQGPAPPFPGLPANVDELKANSERRAEHRHSGTDSESPAQSSRGPDIFTSMTGTAALKVPTSVQTDSLPPIPWRDCGGWGSQFAVPTSEDVYEILKFVPVEWGNLGGLAIPKDIKRRCIRIPSPLEWFRRQPQYFEVRVMMGSTEIRRSVVLHPDAHGMTKDEAKAVVEQHLNDLHNQQQEAMKGGRSDLTSRDMKIQAVNQGKSIPNPAGAPVVSKQSNVSWRNGVPSSANLESWTKLILRVVPSYFIPVIVAVRRAPKKGVFRGADLIDTAKNSPTHFDVLSLSNGTDLLRRKTGVDSTTWGGALKKDLERAITEGTINIVIAMMSKSCGLWDRTHFLYVRLSDHEKMQAGDFDGMVTILRSYPSIFKVGEYYFRRVDHSDPKKELSDIEPQGKDLTAKQRVTNDNPYGIEKDFADVLHYLIPADKPTTLSYLVDCCSPAMRSMIPPRFITLLQLFPHLFKCNEKTPGAFTVEKIEQAAAATPDDD